MKKYFQTILSLSSASIKMYFRDFTAIFFTLIFPVLFLVVFGFIATGDELKLNTAIYSNSNTQSAQQFEKAVQAVPFFHFSDKYPTYEDSKKAISEGDLNFSLFVPANFGKNTPSKLPAGKVTILVNEADQEFNQTIESVIGGILNEFNAEVTKQATGARPLGTFTFEASPVQTKNLEQIDYVVPGIIAFSIMSLGIFSIAQGFISFKANGSLRRLFVTPVGPFAFIAGQSVARLIMCILNVWTMILLAMLLFDFNIVGGFVSIINFTVLAILGAILFLGFGFAIAGWAKDENSAAPIANIIFFPMMFLSGTFFPRELFPEWLAPITNYLPLTYLADGLRQVANEGASILSLGPEILGIAVWGVIAYVIAIKIFRWE